MVSEFLVTWVAWVSFLSTHMFAVKMIFRCHETFSSLYAWNCYNFLFWLNFFNFTRLVLSKVVIHLLFNYTYNTGKWETYRSRSKWRNTSSIALHGKKHNANHLSIQMGQQISKRNSKLTSYIFLKHFFFIRAIFRSGNCVIVGNIHSYEGILLLF